MIINYAFGCLLYKGLASSLKNNISKLTEKDSLKRLKVSSLKLKKKKIGKLKDCLVFDFFEL